MKNRGFSLIEVTVAIALIGLMVGIGVPKFRKQLAIGKDTKAIAILSNLRTASELYYLETGKPLAKDVSNADFKSVVSELTDYLDAKVLKDLEDGKIEIGGSRGKKADTGEVDTTITYGGEIGFTFIEPSTESGGDLGVKKVGDGVYIWFSPEKGKEYDTKGNKWIEY